MLTNLKHRLSRELDEMPTWKKIAYSVGLVAAVVVAVLLLSGTWQPFAVTTGAVHIAKKGQ
jgi:hypothetical protein